jgi:hypothetical protein
MPPTVVPSPVRVGEAALVSGASELAVAVVSGRRAWPRVFVAGDAAVGGEEEEEEDEPAVEEPDPAEPPPEADALGWVTEGVVVAVWPASDVV